MERNLDLSKETDGKLYDLNDMVKVGCNECKGCSACCHDMGNSIVLDPLDIFRLTKALDCSFEELMKEHIELNVVDGIILPNMKMSEKTGSCTFLNNEGRCSIHQSRPGICRIFPLGRLYGNNSFKYILQINECKKPEKTKVKVSKWLDTPDLGENQQFINEWHYLLKDVEALIKLANEDSVSKQLNMYILNLFFITPYNNEEDFYRQVRERIAKTQSVITTLKGQI